MKEKCEWIPPVSPSCSGAAGVTLGSLEDVVAKDQAFKFALESPFGSLMLSFTIPPVASQTKAKPPLLHDHCLPILTHLVPFPYIFIRTHTASETIVIHPFAFIGQKHEASLGI